MLKMNLDGEVFLKYILVKIAEFNLQMQQNSD